VLYVGRQQKEEYNQTIHAGVRVQKSCKTQPYFCALRNLLLNLAGGRAGGQAGAVAHSIRTEQRQITTTARVGNLRTKERKEKDWGLLVITAL
jgi:hypothetical protein